MNERLPVDNYIPDIRKALCETGRAILVAEPGAGKTTLTPLRLLNEDFLDGKSIVILEPRRLAARMAALRMADLIGESPGGTVGYQIRNDRKLSDKTRIHVLTEGILTRRIQHDPMLEDIGLVIFDEFHERNLASDLGLALCLDVKEALRPDLKILVMSATLDTEAVSELMGQAKIIHCPGRMFPVETRYLTRKPAVHGLHSMEKTCTATINEALSRDTGDILVFLPGVREIRRVETRLQEEGLSPGISVHPLYGNLSKKDQDDAVRPSGQGKRKIVLATSIAETSLTIEGVRVVVDTGLMRTPRYFSGTGMSRIETIPVSKASADQRRGRAGRLGPGVCYRLWSEAENGQHPSFSPPEILKTDLAPFMLELALWGVRDPRKLKWLTLPPEGSVKEARGLLTQLGALDNLGIITSHGKKLVQLGIHPRLGHMMLWAHNHHCGYTACLISALLSEGDILSGNDPGSGADIRNRLALFEKGRQAGSIAGVSRARIVLVEKEAETLARRLGIKKESVVLEKSGAILAQAYPERIALSITGGDYGSFKLASGMAGFVRETDYLAGETMIVCADMDGNRKRARIYLAAPYLQDAFEQDFKDSIESKEHIYWDRTMVSCTRRRTYGKLVLNETPCTLADENRIIGILLEVIREEGLDMLPWDKTLRSFQARAVFLKHSGSVSDFPDLSDEALLETLSQWLGPFLSGVRTSAQLKKINLSSALSSLLTWTQNKCLDTMAPTHVTVPSGSRIPLRYPMMDSQTTGTPVLAVRLQELFGLKETPRIAGGNIPVLIHMLSPAGRPVQVTQDLESFWKNTYDEVKKDLKGRYPRHYWPDDPLTARATCKTKKAMDKDE